MRKRAKTKRGRAARDGGSSFFAGALCNKENI